MTSYYVATDGNDNNQGTISAPWQTISKAVNSLNPGDTVNVRRGTYREKIEITKGGNINGYCTLMNYPGEPVIIDAANLVGQWDGAVHINGAKFFLLEGFNIINSDWNGVMISNYNGGGPSNIIIKNNSVSKIARTGIYAENADQIIYDGNLVTQTQNAGGAGGQQNENVNLINVTNFEIKNNKIFGTANYESIDVKMGCSNGKIHHNDISPNMSCGIYCDAQGKDIQNIDIFNNIIRENAHSGVRGIALAVENSGSLRHFKVYNNIVYGLGAIGIVPGTSYSAGPVDDIAVVNNTVYNCGLTDTWGGGIIVEDNNATNIAIRNNICYKNKGIGDLDINSHTTIDKNFVGTDPIFVNEGNLDFHLQPNSPAIKAGSTTQFVPPSDYDGVQRLSPTSIGAYEYGGAGPGPTPPPTPTVYQLTLTQEQLDYAENVAKKVLDYITQLKGAKK